MQHFGETSRQLYIRFTTDRASMIGKIKSNSCKWLGEHFSREICKNVKYSIQIIEKWQGNGRYSSGAIDLAQVVFMRKRETEWMLKLRTVYRFGRNEKVGICEDDKNVKRFKSDDGVGGKLFPSLPRLFQTDQPCRHVNRKGTSILIHKQFVISHNNYLKDDLRHKLNYIRVSLVSINKRQLKENVDRINDILNDQNSQFFFKKWYLMALDIIETKLFKPRKLLKNLFLNTDLI